MPKDDRQLPESSAAQKLAKATLSSRYLIPLATAVLLGICFVVYYLVYVQQNREYLLNRNYRVLATLGAQMSETLANQTATLKSYVNAFEGGEFYESGASTHTYKRGQGQADVAVRPEKVLQENGAFEMSEQIQSFAPRLHHIKLQAIDPKRTVPNSESLERRDGEWVFALAVVDHDGDHEASATIGLQDLSQSFSPSITDTFDDVLIANESGSIVYQKQRIGPHFSNISDFVKTAGQTKASQGDADKGDNSKTDDRGASHAKSEQLVEMDLAGIPYIIFLEPVTIDLNHGRRSEQQQALHFMLAGLVPSSRFRLQSLAISYRPVILLLSAFLLLCLSTPIIKILFLNERSRLVLREIVLLPLLFLIVAGVLTSVCLQTIYFNLGHSDTDSELQQVSSQMQANIKSEITAMRAQLVAACQKPDLAEDLQFRPGSNLTAQVIRTNVLESEFQTGALYPYFSNMFWTDAKGRQIVKWSAAPHATPLIDVSRLEFFRGLDTNNHYFFLDESKPFRLDSLLPPNQDSYIGVLGMRMSDCAGPGPDRTGFAFLSARPLSLIDPVLPLGFGFALVDDTGQVLFHSDKFRNNRENILIETSNDRELTASIYGHSDEEFSVDYRGNEVRARVVSISGVGQSPWSLVVYKDARYEQTYDLEVITMAGAFLFVYMGILALVVLVFYSISRLSYVPDWLWPSESMRRVYRFQIAAGIAMTVLSATLIFLRPIEESLFAAVSAGYVTLIIVLWSTLFNRPGSHTRTIFAWICWLAAIVMVVFPLVQRWWRSVFIGLILFPFAWALRGRKHLRFAPWRSANLSYRSLYYIRALVLFTVVGILPPLSFFRNSMLLEDTLHIRAAQLHAAIAWNARERMIENLDKEVHLISSKQIDSNGVLANRCSTVWDFYLGSYFGTEVQRQPHPRQPHSRTTPSSYHLDDGFLRFAHMLHHSYNDIGAEALGVLRNPALPEGVYIAKSDDKATDQAQGDLPAWEWEFVESETHKKYGRPSQLRVHEGADFLNPCAASDNRQQPKNDLVVSSALPPSRVSALSNLFTWLLVTAVIGTLFWSVMRKIFLFDLGEPLSQSGDELQELLKRPGNILVLTSSRRDWTPDLAPGATRIDVRELAAQPMTASRYWGETFDWKKLPAESAVVVENFDWELGSPEVNRQRLFLIDALVSHSFKVIIVSAVKPSLFLIDHANSAADEDAGRWASLLGAFTRINLAHRPIWTLGTAIKRENPALWRECSVQPELQRVAKDLWQARGAVNALTPDQMVSEVGERAAQYYYLEWQSCTEEEWFLLAGLARDGIVNPKNPASLRQLLRRRLIVRNPQFRIMNESFRRFVIAQAGASLQQVWEAEAAGSGWGKARIPFATALVLVGLFLLATQQQFLHSSAGVLTGVAGGLAALLKLIAVVQGKSSDA